jgi:hypothetical protein
MEMILTDSPLMTAERAATVAGCSANYLRRKIKEGRVEAIKTIGGGWVLTQKTALEFRKTLSSRAGCNRDKPKAGRKSTPRTRRAG